MMLGYGISLIPAIKALPSIALFSSPLAQRAEDAAGVLSDISTTDPELSPRKEKFTEVDICTDKAPDYQYAALTSPSSIRLLELWSSEPPQQENPAARIGYTVIRGEDFRQSIWCRIVHRDLSESSQPGYETISYTWAGLPKCIPIFVDNGEVIRINPPIYACLQRLEVGSSPRYLWIDQICINQTDTNELNIQVLMMKRIFESAEKTLIWLGEEDEDTPLAFECISKIPALDHPPMESREVPESTKKVVEAVIGKDIGQPESSAYKARLAVGRLLNRGWFERAWVYQEAAVSSHVVVRTGSHEVGFTQFCTAVRAFCDVEREKWRSFGRSLTIATRGYNTLEVIEFGRRRLAEARREAEDAKKTEQPNEKAELETSEKTAASEAKFLGLMFRLAGIVKASDHRDLVYSFLGFQDIEHPIIKPNYSLSLPEVYRDAARSFIESAQSLDVFGITSITGRSTGLPSWAPDWTQKSPQGVPLYRPDVASSFRASKKFTHHHTLSSDNARYLVVKGRIIDTVALVSPHDFDLDNRNKGGLEVFLKLRQHLTYFRETRPPPIALQDKLGATTDARPGANDTAPRKPFVDMFDGQVHQLKRLIKTILADNAYKFYPREEEKTGQVPISASDLEDYHAAYANEDPIRQRNSFLSGLDHLTAVRDEFRGNMLISVKRRLFHGDQACLGLAPEAVKVGDLVCILHGSRVPCILRRADAVDRYELVGQCYYEDWMYGDHIDWAEEDADTFELQ